ncbi:MAG: Gfo/Idh/MocA family oxidoreductase [Clostridium sp.]|nr:Gfo/Idh/MocA family oxidoreductase [Clostridium sp.]
MINVGILGCSEIAYRRFMPEAIKYNGINVKVVGEEYDAVKLDDFCNTYEIEGTTSFEEIIYRKDIDAVYIPQPPALHYKWAKLALESGKHVLIEKPSTTCAVHTQQLVDIARQNKLALHENYMFQYHSQIFEIQKMLKDGIIGDVRLFRANFGFPKRQSNDFRYNAPLGGGALLDAGGYTLKLATLFLGNTIKVDTAQLMNIPNYEVDMYGSASLSNSFGDVFQVSFGMDNYYQCNLEIWGSVGKLWTNRIFTAPPDYVPVVNVETAEGEKTILLQKDAHFRHSIEEFCNEIIDAAARDKMYNEIVLQASLVSDLLSKSKK